MNFTIPRLQNIPSSQARFCLTVEKFLCEDLGLQGKERTFIVGYSGGIDSTALLTLLYLLKPRLSFNLVAAHLDHGIRDESKAEAKHCEKVASYFSIPFFTKQVSIPASQKNGKGIEEASRRYRYAFFDEICKEFPNATIALGHHLNDLAEDMLMRLIRGAGWPTLSGMPGVDDKRSLCRPLLLTPKQTILEFISALDIPYVQDSSNEDLHYFRNRVRHSLLPFFLEENPSFLQTVANLWQMGRIDKELFDELLGAMPIPVKNPCSKTQKGSIEQSDDKEEFQSRSHETPFSLISSRTEQPFLASFQENQAESAATNTSTYIKISQEKLTSLSRSLRLRLYKKVIEQLRSHPLATNILQLDTLWVTKKTGALLQFPNKVNATIKRDGIIFLQKK